MTRPIETHDTPEHVEFALTLASKLIGKKAGPFAPERFTGIERYDDYLDRGDEGKDPERWVNCQ